MDIQTDPAVRPLSAMENLEKQLSCPICLDMFQKPVVILPCQHNLCRSCANDLYESKNPYRYSGGTFRCPTCRFEVMLDRHGVLGLQRNLLVENIIDMYKQQQESRGGGEDTPLKDKDAKEPKCQEHEEERINIYCVSCQTPTCSMCKVFGQHQTCEVAPLLAVYQSQKNELRAAVEQLATGNGCVQVAAAQMDQTCKVLRDNGELQRRRLGESFDLLYAIMEERKAQLLEHIDHEERHKMAALRALGERWKQQLQLSSRLQEELQEKLQRCGAADFLLAAKQLKEEVQRAASGERPTRPEPGYENMDHLSLDTEQVEALLARVDFRRDDQQDPE